MKIYNRKSLTVASSRGVLLGKRIDYKLIKSYGIPPIYSISIAFNGDRRERSVSRDITKAAKLYGLIVKNLVTPCTLDDVLDDYLSNFLPK